MPAKRNSLLFVLIALSAACSGTSLPHESSSTPKPVVTTDDFAYPIGKTETVTQMKDSDEWFNAQDFGENSHLGEDWNKNSGGDADCGEPVYPQRTA